MKKKSKNKTVPSPNVEENTSEIRKYAKIIASSMGIKLIEDLASSDERKAVWVSCSGKLTREQIVQQSGVSMHTVSTFIDLLKTCGLVEEETGKGGHPKRVVDYVSSEWKGLAKKKKKPDEKQQPTEEPKPSEEQKPEVTAVT